MLMMGFKVQTTSHYREDGCDVRDEEYHVGRRQELSVWRGFWRIVIEFEKPAAVILGEASVGLIAPCGNIR